VGGLDLDATTVAPPEADALGAGSGFGGLGFFSPLAAAALEAEALGAGSGVGGLGKKIRPMPCIASHEGPHSGGQVSRRSTMPARNAARSSTHKASRGCFWWRTSMKSTSQHSGAPDRSSGCIGKQPDDARPKASRETGASGDGVGVAFVGRSGSPRSTA